MVLAVAQTALEPGPIAGLDRRARSAFDADALQSSGDARSAYLPDAFRRGARPRWITPALEAARAGLGVEIVAVGLPGTYLTAPLMKRPL